MNHPEDTNGGPVIRDRRRIDPATGAVRATAPEAGSQSGMQSRTPGRAGDGSPGQGSPHTAAEAAAAQAQLAQAKLAERTADLQRLQAEYANYRKRVERDRMAVREQALANVLAEFLPILDDIGRAREHGELSGGFKSVAESVEAAVAKLGLASYGENGDRFDPVIHEALTHSYSAQVSEPTCVQVLQPGYKIGDRILRPARVAVAEPGGASPQDAAADAEAGDQGQARDGEPDGDGG